MIGGLRYIEDIMQQCDNMSFNFVEQYFMDKHR